MRRNQIQAKVIETLLDISYLVLFQHIQQISEKFLVLGSIIAIARVSVSVHCPLELCLNSIMGRWGMSGVVWLWLHTIK